MWIFYATCGGIRNINSVFPLLAIRLKMYLLNKFPFACLQITALIRMYVCVFLLFVRSVVVVHSTFALNDLVRRYARAPTKAYLIGISSCAVYFFFVRLLAHSFAWQTKCLLLNSYLKMSTLHNKMPANHTPSNNQKEDLRLRLWNQEKNNPQFMCPLHKWFLSNHFPNWTVFNLSVSSMRASMFNLKCLVNGPKAFTFFQLIKSFWLQNKCEFKNA